MPEGPEVGNRRYQFEMVTFPSPTGIPHGWDEELLRKGVPKAMFGYYQAANRLTLVEVDSYGSVICFGTCGRSCRVCLNPRTGEVVSGLFTLPGERPDLVNSSLDQFIASVHAVLERFPFDSANMRPNHTQDDSELDELESEWDRAADELIETLRCIDPVAVANPDTFWMVFMADLQMGNFASNDVLDDPDE